MDPKYLKLSIYLDFLRHRFSYVLKIILLLGKNVSLARSVDVHLSSELRAGSGFITVGPSSLIDNGVVIRAYGGKISIGSNTTIGPYTCIYGGGELKIGDDVRIGPMCAIVAANHQYKDPTMPIYLQGMMSKGIEICDDVWLGARVSILDGVCVGKGAVIASGAVVTRSIPAGHVYAGVPARFIGSRGIKDDV